MFTTLLDPLVKRGRCKMSFGFKDFDAFGRWYTERRRRSTGRSASPNTLRTKQVHLARICNEMGYQESVFLCHALCDRRELVFLLDRLAAKMTPRSEAHTSELQSLLR